MHRTYFSRRSQSNVQLRPKEYLGLRSPLAWLWQLLFLTVPMAYIYIALCLVREACWTFPTFANSLQQYVPFFHRFILTLQSQPAPSRWLIDSWCFLEGIFYIWMKLRIRYLQVCIIIDEEGQAGVIQRSFLSHQSIPIIFIHSQEIHWKHLYLRHP